MRHRQHPRRPGLRPGLFVAGGQTGQPEDFLSDPPAGGPLESPPAANLPARQDITMDTAEAVAAAILFDREASAEPYQVDITRGLDDTVRMGNNLSAAVRLELLADSLREETRDRRPGPGFPADYPAPSRHFTDPVDGAELDEVDGLPVGADCDGGQHVPMLDGRCALCNARLADDGRELEELAAPLVLSSPGPARPPTERELVAMTTEELREYGRTLPVVPPLVSMTPAQARTTGGARARVLNWTSHHDPASLEYGVRQRLRAPAPLMDRAWPHGPILDQGTAPPLSLHDASGCTGHAGANARNILTVADHTGPADLAAPWDSGDAMRLYEAAQVLDEVPGEAYPGTSILALMKAGQQLGAWDAYLWAFGTRDIAQAILQVGPVIVGIPWLSGMTEPGPDGIVTVTGDDQGGHALCLFALRMSVAEKAGPWFGALQTWGEGIGDGGVIWFHHRDLAQLLHGLGEAAIPILGQP